MEKLNKLSAGMVSFLRPEYTRECIRSLRENWPGVKTVVVDNGKLDVDSYEWYRKNADRFEWIEYDSGVCKSRNYLMQLIDTPYVLLGDDDFYYTEDAVLDKMVQFLEDHKDFDLIGGRINENGNVRNYQGLFYFGGEESRELWVEPLQLSGFIEEDGFRWKPADLTFNFFVARTKTCKKIKWDEEIKVSWDHLSWFLDLYENGHKVAFTPDSIVIHKPDWVTVPHLEEYKVHRYNKEGRERFYTYRGFTQVTDVYGNVDCFGDGNV